MIGDRIWEDWGNDLKSFAFDFKIRIVLLISRVEVWGKIGDRIVEDCRNGSKYSAWNRTMADYMLVFEDPHWRMIGV